ncbi:exodeoxyribonuclease V subunit gamma [Patescibacteria group bacterium]|nr:exodeoxyribonuclease V subunit gamma [Patescibacteria group bacterium]
MTIELYFSNQLDELAYKFSEVVTDEVRGKSNILEPPVVIVPNANLAKWLQLFLAGENSIFMNFRFQFLEAGLWGMLAALDAGENKPDMMDEEQLEILLLHILQNLDRGDIDFLPVTQYLFGEDSLSLPLPILQHYFYLFP